MPLLAALKPTALRRMLVSMTTEFYLPGEYVMRQGDTVSGDTRAVFFTRRPSGGQCHVLQWAAGERVCHLPSP